MIVEKLVVDSRTHACLFRAFHGGAEDEIDDATVRSVGFGRTHSFDSLHCVGSRFFASGVSSSAYAASLTFNVQITGVADDPGGSIFVSPTVGEFGTLALEFDFTEALVQDLIPNSSVRYVLPFDTIGFSDLGASFDLQTPTTRVGAGGLFDSFEIEIARGVAGPRFEASIASFDGGVALSAVPFTDTAIDFSQLGNPEATLSAIVEDELVGAFLIFDQGPTTEFRGVLVPATSQQPIPEPEAMALFAIGLLVVGPRAMWRRRAGSNGQ